MQRLGLIKEVAQKDHQQKHAAEGQDARLGQFQQFAVAVRVVDGGIKGLAQANAARQGHHQQGTEQPHTKNGNDQTPGEEKALLGRGQLIQYTGIDHRVVKGKRDLQHQQHQGDPGGAGTQPAHHDRQTRRTADEREDEVAQIALGHQFRPRATIASSCAAYRRQ